MPSCRHVLLLSFLAIVPLKPIISPRRAVRRDLTPCVACVRSSDLHQCTRILHLAVTRHRPQKMGKMGFFTSSDLLFLVFHHTVLFWMQTRVLPRNKQSEIDALSRDLQLTYTRYQELETSGWRQKSLHPIPTERCKK